MSDRQDRFAGRRRGSLIPDAVARPQSARPPSLLSVAVERASLRQTHREAAAVRKALARPLSDGPTAARAAENALFAEWDRPDPEPANEPAPLPPPEPTPLRPPEPRQADAAGDPGGGDAWRPLIDPMALVDGLMRSRALILSTTALGALAGVLFALSTPKQYPAFAEILVDPRNLQIVDRDLTGSGYMASDATLSLIENQVRIMRSGPVLTAVVDKLNLDDDPEFNGAGKSFGLGAAISTLRGLFSAESPSTEGEARAALTVGNLARAVSAERSGKTFVVDVEVVSRDAEKSALIANALVDVYLARSADFQADSAGRASDELGGRLEDMRKDLDASERKVENYKAEQDLVDAKGVLIGDDELVRLNDQLTVARARTLELNAKAASARLLDAESVIAGNLPEQVANSGLAQLRTQYAGLAQELARVSVRLGPRHPARQAAEAQLADARASIAAELRRIVASVQVEMKRAVQLEQELSARLAQLKARQATVSDKLVELRELERDAASKRAVYESYLLRARETGEQKGINTANVSVISRATPSLEPSGPSRAMIAILGTILGFAVGVGLGVLRGAWTALRHGDWASRLPQPPSPGRRAVVRPAPLDAPVPAAVRPVPPSAGPVHAEAAPAPPPPSAPPPVQAASAPVAWMPQHPAFVAPPHPPLVAPQPLAWAQAPAFVQPMPAPVVYAQPVPHYASAPFAPYPPAPYSATPFPAAPYPAAPYPAAPYPAAPYPAAFAPPAGYPVPPPAAYPAPPAAPAAPGAPETSRREEPARLDAVRAGLSRFREAVESIEAARPRRQR